MRQASIKAEVTTERGDIHGNLKSFLRNIKPSLSDLTVRVYGDTIRRLAAFLESRGMPTDVADITREHLEEFLIDMQERGYRPASVATYHRGMCRFFKWLLEEGEITKNPMERIKGPKVTPPPTPVLTADQLKRLLEVVDRDNTFEGRRDAAIVRIFVDCGARRHEISSLKWTPDDPETNDVELDQQYLRIHGKGGRWRIAPLGARAVKALDRYLRLRDKSEYRDLPWLWLSNRGRLTDKGVFQLIKRRGREAGIELFPHQLRHSFAHHWLAQGGTEGDLMAIAGWTSPDMLARYGASGKTERARAAHKRLGLGDRL